MVAALVKGPDDENWILAEVRLDILYRYRYLVPSTCPQS